MIILVFFICFIIFAISANRVDVAQKNWIENYNIGDVYTPPFIWSLLMFVSLALTVFSIFVMVLLKSN